MSDCLFCKMVNGDIKPDIAYETDSVLAFRDLNPQAPTHILIIPKQHISTLNELEDNHAQVVGELYLAAKEIAKQQGIAEAGYRTLINCNEDGGQTVFHLHLHLMGGRVMKWPPG